MFMWPNPTRYVWVCPVCYDEVDASEEEVEEDVVWHTGGATR